MKSGLREIPFFMNHQDVECEIYMDLAFSVCSSIILSNDKFFFYNSLYIDSCIATKMDDEERLCGMEEECISDGIALQMTRAENKEICRYIVWDLSLYF